ncbi:ABC transporter permease [Bradyrhizobium amphicarpaeae]|uniref:ABC transporter permease n=1 Tax=Bradyrhizobium amphicarpaeae TaxID=1404768 RepID=A0A2U8PRB8_9BRAD|nr:ABC transporter permease [Bradyrhizobium amphicarpaeae]AWM00329.1 ABC transporter permease [Bradyrhizobium amphicarpaeae]
MSASNIRFIAFIGGSTAFLISASIFLATIGKPPLTTLSQMVYYAFGDSYSLSESLVKATPILLCALAVILPARLGLITVGGEGQLYFGALTGTAIVVGFPTAPMLVLLPVMILAGAAGGAAWSGFAGLLRAHCNVNETISTLLMNYVAVLLVNYVTYGAWKDPASLGWPATMMFPPAAIVPSVFGTRVHAGLIVGIMAAILLHIAVTYTRWGIALRVIAGNRKVAAMAGFGFVKQTIMVMAMGGALAGFAGICETSAIQGRLQAGISVGYGLTGFLVAWLSGQNFLRAVPIAILIGGLIAAGDALQLYSKIPSASATILQGLLFIAALAASGLAGRRTARHG